MFILILNHILRSALNLLAYIPFYSIIKLKEWESLCILWRVEYIIYGKCVNIYISDLLTSYLVLFASVITIVSNFDIFLLIFMTFQLVYLCILQGPIDCDYRRIMYYLKLEEGCNMFFSCIDFLLSNG